MAQLLYIVLEYRKIPKINSGAYIFQRPFLRGLIFGGAYIRRRLSPEGNLRFKIDWASLIVGRKFTRYSFFFLVFEGNFQVQARGGGGAYIWRCDFTEGFLRYELYLEKLIHGGAYFRNFTVFF